MDKYQLVRFEDNDFTLDVRTDVENETVWLTQEDIAYLFDRDQGVISRHINNIFKEGETLEILVKEVFSGNGIVSFDCIIYNQGEETASATVNVYQGVNDEVNEGVGVKG